MADLLTARQRRLFALRYGPDGLPVRPLRAVGAVVGGTDPSTICREIRGALRKLLRAHHAGSPDAEPFRPILEYEHLIPDWTGVLRDRPPRRRDAKLTWERVRAVRARHAAGQCSPARAARELAISRKTIRQIPGGEKWREPEGSAPPRGREGASRAAGRCRTPSWSTARARPTWLSVWRSGSPVRGRRRKRPSRPSGARCARRRGRAASADAITADPVALKAKRRVSVHLPRSGREESERNGCLQSPSTAAVR
jgi:hypothetical protein